MSIIRREFVENGDFETHGALNRGTWGTFATISGWKTLNNEHIELQQNSIVDKNAGDGTHIELDTGNSGRSGIYQDIGTDTGDHYTLKFSYFPRADVNKVASDIQVWWDGELLAIISGNESGWQDYEFTVTGGSANTSRLMFKSLGEDRGMGGLLDNVSVKSAIALPPTNEVKHINTGSDADDFINGNNDIYDKQYFDGKGGDDIITGGYGHDNIEGGNGNDTLYGDSDKIGNRYQDVNIITSGISAGYPMADNRFGTIIELASSGGNNQAYIDAGDIVTGSNFSFASWVRFNASHANNWERIIDFGNGAGRDNILLAREGTSNNLAFHVYNNHGGNEVALSVPNQIVKEQWFHVAVTLEEHTTGVNAGKITAKIFINGVEQASSTGNYNITTMARQDNYIGKSHWAHDGNSDIQVTGMTIANRGLNASEVTSIKNNTDNPTNSNAGKITFDNGLDSKAHIQGQDEDVIDGGAGDDAIYGSGGDDIIRGNIGKDYIDAGNEDDHIVVVGTIKAGEYDHITQSIKSSDGTDLSTLLKLSDIQQARTVSDITAGETIIGGAGTDTLHIFGYADMRNVNMIDLEKIQLNSGGTFAVTDIAGIRGVSGSGDSVLALTTKSTSNVDFSSAYIKDLTGLGTLRLQENVTLQINSFGDFKSMGLGAITGFKDTDGKHTGGKIQIQMKSADIDNGVKLGDYGFVFGDKIKVYDIDDVEIDVTTIGNSVVSRTYTNIENAKGNYFAPTVMNDSAIGFEDNDFYITFDYLLGNDKDYDDGDVLSIVENTIALTGANADKATLTLVDSPSDSDGKNDKIKIALKPDFNGDLTISYKVTDDNADNPLTSNATLSLTIKNTNDAPVVDTNKARSVSIQEGNVATVTYAELEDIIKDIDPNDTKTIKNIQIDPSSASNATLKLVSSTIGGAIDQVQITPKDLDDFNGQIKFTFDVSDKAGATVSSDYTVKFTAVNDVPVANDDIFYITDASATEYTINFANLLANDTDADTKYGDKITVTGIFDQDITNGKLDQDSIDYKNGTAKFKFADGAYSATLTYSIKDENSGTDTATIRLVKPQLDGLDSLNGKNGFIVHNPTTASQTGYGVNNIGDINGDGYADILISAPSMKDNDASNGIAYVIYGKASDFDASFDVTTMTSADGFKVSGVGGNLGFSVDGGKDVNGDHIDDFLISSNSHTYIVYGQTSNIADIDLSGNFNGITYNKGTHQTYTYPAFSRLLDDVNNDGIDDFYVYGSDDGDIVFGQSLASNTHTSLTRSSDRDIKIDSPRWIESGDLNNDGYTDIIVGYPGNSGGHLEVIYGSSSGLPTDAQNNLNFNNAITVTENTHLFGYSPSLIDINGDNIDDLIIATGYRNFYAIYGRNSPIPASLDVSSDSNYFTINTAGEIQNNLFIGMSIKSAGDFNGDGYNDIILGQHQNRGYDGDAYLLFGGKNVLSELQSLSSIRSITSDKGLILNGLLENQGAGFQVSGGNDVNGDGFDDIIVGGYTYPNINGVRELPNDADGNNAYVIYGFDVNGVHSTSITNSGTSASETITGSAVNDTLSGNDGNDIIRGGNGDDKITGGTGNDKLDGGHGNDEFIFDNGDGKDIILDFEDSTASSIKDRIDLSSYTKGASKIKFDDLSISKSGGDTKITGLDSGDEILIRNIDSTKITADDFIFG